MLRIILVVVVSLSVGGCLGGTLGIGRDYQQEAAENEIAVENEFRLAWVRKAGCSEEDIKEQYKPLTYREVWDRDAQNPRWSWGDSIRSFREELYLLPCVKIPPQ